MPLTPIYLAAVNGTGVTGSIRPDYTGAPLYSATGGRNLNPAAYTAPPLGEWGNAGRISITGPAQFNLNASMARTSWPLALPVPMDLEVDALPCAGDPGSVCVALAHAGPVLRRPAAAPSPWLEELKAARKQLAGEIGTVEGLVFRVPGHLDRCRPRRRS